jgi:hypothetical protein
MPAVNSPDSSVAQWSQYIWPVKKVVELVEVPTLYRWRGKGRAWEGDDETLYCRASDSLLASHLSISLAKNVATTESRYQGTDSPTSI